MRTGLVVILIGLFNVCQTAAAQERIVIRGQVLDNETQKPIAGANVSVRGEKKGVATDSSGYFRLDLTPGTKHVLAFSHVAYRKETREIAPDGVKDVEFRIGMTPEPISLQEVVVYGKQDVVLTKAAVDRAAYRLGGEEFEKLGEEDMERAQTYFLPDVVKRLDKRMMSNADDFSLYVNGEWRESLTLSDINPFSIRRVLVWEQLGRSTDIDAQGRSLGYGKSINVFPPGLPLRRGKFVVLVETR